MGIVADDIEKVRQATDIVELVSKHLALRRVGRRWVGLCPFHGEKTPSFNVNQERGFYKCFGCGAGGDVITFVREIEHTDFVGAVESLAARAGITLRYTDANESADRQRRNKLLDAMRSAVDWYHERLLTAPDAAKARGYLRRDRGLDGDTVRKYKIGWAPDEFDAMCRALHLPEAVLRDTGLGFINRRNRPQDAFRARVLFPIFDANGDPVAFGGRMLPGGEPPKYKNSPETPIYTKSRVLYGLNWAKADVVQANQIIVCEGYTDVIGFDLAGMPRAVAPCGTALTEDHVRLMSRFATRVVLAFDPDAAGNSAAERFYEWEQKHQLDVFVAALPAGVDPADLAQRDPAALRAAVDHATPYLGFRVARALGATDTGTPEGRARAAEAALAVVREHPSDLVRDQYLMQIATASRIDVDVLRGRLRGAGRPLTSPASTSSAATRSGSTRGDRADEPSGPEIEALRLLVHRWNEIAPWMDEVLFSDPVHLAAFRALASTSNLHEAVEAAAPEAAELLIHLAVEDHDADPVLEACHLIADVASRALRAVDAEIRRTGDLSEAPTVAWLKTTIEACRDPERGPESASELLGWLVNRDEERASGAWQT